jgi:hypothetical protein
MTQRPPVAPRGRGQACTTTRRGSTRHLLAATILDDTVAEKAPGWLRHCRLRDRFGHKAAVAVTRAPYRKGQDAVVRADAELARASAEGHVCPHTTYGANLRARPRHARVRAALRRDVRRREDALDRGRTRRRVDRDRRSRHPWKGGPTSVDTRIVISTSDIEADHTALKAAGVDVDAEIARWGHPNARVGVLRARLYERCVDAPRSTLTFPVITLRLFLAAIFPSGGRGPSARPPGLHAFPPGARPIPTATSPQVRARTDWHCGDVRPIRFSA